MDFGSWTIRILCLSSSSVSSLWKFLARTLSLTLFFILKLTNDFHFRIEERIYKFLHHTKFCFHVIFDSFWTYWLVQDTRKLATQINLDCSTLFCPPFHWKIIVQSTFPELLIIDRNQVKMLVAQDHATNNECKYRKISISDPYIFILCFLLVFSFRYIFSVYHSFILVYQSRTKLGWVQYTLMRMGVPQA